jgi:6-pyruvoyltetrahydropterin/6-carboxytetrahydropterin synthase
MTTMRITREFTFDAAHSLPDHPKCGRLHGHTWYLRVGLEGPINHKTGMVADFSNLKRVVEDLLELWLDHSFLNDLMLNPTCENLAGWIANELSQQIPEPITKIFIRLQEGKGGWVDYELERR